MFFNRIHFFFPKYHNSDVRFIFIGGRRNLPNVSSSKRESDNGVEGRTFVLLFFILCSNAFFKGLFLVELERKGEKSLSLSSEEDFEDNDLHLLFFFALLKIKTSRKVVDFFFFFFLDNDIRFIDLSERTPLI